MFHGTTVVPIYSYLFAELVFSLCISVAHIHECTVVCLCMKNMACRVLVLKTSVNLV